jgi:ABC-type multidrug transport system fused ATPase/permease subunit
MLSLVLSHRAMFFTAVIGSFDRLTTAMRADRVVVIDRGQVVEDCTHAQLLERAGPYAAMFAVWAEHSRHQLDVEGVGAAAQAR